jgi:hypothetical protein
VDDLERRRTLLFALLLGDVGSKVVHKIAGRTGPYWARSITRSIPMSSINAINNVLGPRFITKYGTKQGVLVLGRDLPFGIGIGIGAGGNLLLGIGTIRTARHAFGPPPDSWPDGEGWESASSRCSPAPEPHDDKPRSSAVPVRIRPARG